MLSDTARRSTSTPQKNNHPSPATAGTQVVSGKVQRFAAEKLPVKLNSALLMYCSWPLYADIDIEWVRTTGTDQAKGV